MRPQAERKAEIGRDGHVLSIDIANIVCEQRYRLNWRQVGAGVSIGNESTVAPPSPGGKGTGKSGWEGVGGSVAIGSHETSGTVKIASDLVSAASARLSMLIPEFPLDSNATPSWSELLETSSNASTPCAIALAVLVALASSGAKLREFSA